MSTEISDAGSAGGVVSPASETSATLLHAAWLAILLGFAMEALLLALSEGIVEDLPALSAIAADLLRNVSWSVVVCGGLALGQTVARLRTPAMGALGVLAAPLAFEVSRAVHKGALGALSFSSHAPAASPETSPFLLAAVKGIEYGCLGLVVAWLGARSWGGLFAHAGAGLLVGLVFGGVVLALTASAAPHPSGAELAPQAVNEVLFPVGCSVTLFSAGSLGRRISDRRAPEHRP